MWGLRPHNKHTPHIKTLARRGAAGARETANAIINNKRKTPMKLWRYGHAIEHLGQRYRLEGSLGSGGMADVCLAWDEHEACEVAIKVIKSDQLEQRTLDRFIKEAAQV